MNSYELHKVQRLKLSYQHSSVFWICSILEHSENSSLQITYLHLGLATAIQTRVGRGVTVDEGWGHFVYDAWFTPYQYPAIVQQGKHAKVLALGNIGSLCVPVGFFIDYNSSVLVYKCMLM